MKAAFQDLAGDAGPPRPVVDLTLLELPFAGQTCVLDTGLLGLGGLLPFRTTVCAYEEWSELAPLDA